MTVLAIDQGTTSTRALLVSAEGQVTPLRSLPHRQLYPQGGWVEHDAEELVANLQACLASSAPHAPRRHHLSGRRGRLGLGRDLHGVEQISVFA